MGGKNPIQVWLQTASKSKIIAFLMQGSSPAFLNKEKTVYAVTSNKSTYVVYLDTKMEFDLRIYSEKDKNNIFTEQWLKVANTAQLECASWYLLYGLHIFKLLKY